MIEKILASLAINKSIDCIIFSAGEWPSQAHLASLLNTSVLTICADSSLEYALEYGFNIDYAVGDFDSLSDKTLLQKVKQGYQSHYKDKELTDTQLAFKLAKDKGCRSILLAGGSGHRVDHFIDNWSLWSMNYGLNYWLTAHELMLLIDHSQSIATVAGQTLSICSLSNMLQNSLQNNLHKPIDLECHTLKWPLNSSYWHSHSHSTSNVATGKLDISISSGLAVLFLPYATINDNDTNAKSIKAYE